MKYLSSIIIVGISIFLLTPSAHACSCSGRRSFVESAEESELVVRGKVISYQWQKDVDQQKARPLAMTVEVEEVYKGKTKLGKITVWGDNGNQCRPYVTRFPIGTDWVLALSNDSEDSQEELAISVCGEHWLQVQGRNVIGKVTDGSSQAKPQVISLLELRKLLKVAP